MIFNRPKCKEVNIIIKAAHFGCDMHATNYEIKNDWFYSDSL